MEPDATGGAGAVNTNPGTGGDVVSALDQAETQQDVLENTALFMANMQMGEQQQLDQDLEEYVGVNEAIAQS